MRGHNTQPPARLPLNFLGLDTWMTSKLNVALIRKLGGSLVYLTYFLTCYPWVFVHSGTIADVRLICAGNKCLCCTWFYDGDEKKSFAFNIEYSVFYM